ncbi:MAG: acyl-CoA thioesterase [Chloroflexi bacterium]|nr:MAG: acyl-CoA thioesterase [Deltaproteobacteria bacterium]TMB36418.1 MAG: acyl-CoA thioesterase [Deltaproteobacteria bacterium]TMF86204.1 MAG: acyl-CoA thioesterase [Chloroflexota bacterium]
MIEEPRRARGDFAHFLEIVTRWADNDVYGHVNNATYYSYFDTLVNQMLIERNLLDPAKSASIGVVVETGCHFFASLSFPDVIDAGLRVSSIGNSSVRYEIALFRHGENEPAATGHFVHVYVDRATRRPVPVPAEVRAGLEPLIRAVT